MSEKGLLAVGCWPLAICFFFRRFAVQDYRKLEVWRLMHEVTLEVYRATKQFPSDERFGLTSQVRRASASVGANLAEGCGRGSDPDFARFVQMGIGSASEVDYHLLLSKDLGYLPEAPYTELIDKLTSVRRMLYALLARLQKSQQPIANSQ